MSTTTPTHKTGPIDAQTQTDDLDDRDIKALLTPMTVIDDCGDVRDQEGMFEVTTDSGSMYTVDNVEKTCTCPDHEYRGVRCKHIRRVEFEIGERAIPGWVNVETLDDQLGMHVSEGEPRIAMCDGGVVSQRESVADSARGLAARVGFVVGVDAEGDVHVHHPATDSVNVHAVDDDYEVGDYIGGEPKFERDLEGRPLSEWMAYVAHERGEWQMTTHRAPEGFGGGRP